MTPSPDDIDGLWPDTRDISSIVLRGHTVTIGVGDFNISKIEKWAKPGEHSWIPYVRVWTADRVISEHIQHALDAVYFD